MLYTPICGISSYDLEILRNGRHKVSIHEILRLNNHSTMTLGALDGNILGPYSS